MLSRSVERTARAQRLIVVSLIAVALGFLLVVQLRSQAAVARSLAAQDDTSVALLINDLNRANNQLIHQRASLTQQDAQLRQALTAARADVKATQMESGTLRDVNAERPGHGRAVQ